VYSGTHTAAPQMLEDIGLKSCAPPGLNYSRATVSSFTLSKTSIASVSFPNDSERVSKVRVWMVMGFSPCNVCGKRVTRAIRGYGICRAFSYAS